jgi:orotate phosphoribosyltransferase
MSIESILIETQTLMEGHFILASGRHSARYMQCARILQYPWHAERMCGEIIAQFNADGGFAVDAVLCPATGGIIVAYELSRQLGVMNLFAEREEGKMKLRRGFALPNNARVLVAEDVVTTGGTVQEVIELAEAHGAQVVGVAVLVDRSMGAVSFGVPLKAAYTADVVSWDAADCPLCREGKIPAEKPGSRGKS